MMIPLQPILMRLNYFFSSLTLSFLHHMIHLIFTRNSSINLLVSSRSWRLLLLWWPSQHFKLATLTEKNNNKLLLLCVYFSLMQFEKRKKFNKKNLSFYLISPHAMNFHNKFLFFFFGLEEVVISKRSRNWGS